MRKPDIDIGACTLCMGCVEVCSDVFRYNDAGYIEIVELDRYPENDVDEAIKFCPEDCISWNEE
ncbi:MAG: ferredoxin [Desulfobacterales bacterium SG8_35_2]|nr:MAG: ferredoxin [Desulfobacterales bacterium SG8_35_2]